MQYLRPRLFLPAACRPPACPARPGAAPRSASRRLNAGPCGHHDVSRGRGPPVAAASRGGGPDGDAELSTLEVVAQLPSDAKVALVCATEEGVRSKERSIHAVGIHRPNLMTATLQQEGKLSDVLRRADVVLASPQVLERISGRIPPNAKPIRA